MENFSITVNSLPDRENLVAEIYYKNYQVAEISQETDELIIQIYSYKEKDCWEFLLEEFQKVIEEAKKKLLAVG